MNAVQSVNRLFAASMDAPFINSSLFLIFIPKSITFDASIKLLHTSSMGTLSLQDISLWPIFAGMKQVGRWWNFKHVISPFYRLYYVESGAARVCVDDVWHELRPSQLFLIPKYACHSYECNGEMNHYYVCFFDDLVRNGVPRPDKMVLQVQAEPYDLALIRRFLHLNPGMELVNVDPKAYNRAVYDGAAILSHARKEMESCGILMQLFSRFVTDECLGHYVGTAANGKFDDIVNYIHNHLERHIPLSELADRACLTTGHFSKVFKQGMGTSPCLYMQNRRIKRAQTLLLTTNMTITQVAEKVGIYSPAQFTRLFTKIAGCKPKDYRARQLGCCC